MTPEQALDLLRQLVPEANHIAKDKSQVVWWYNQEPKQGDHCWLNSDISGLLSEKCTIEWPSDDWKDCIVSHEEPITDEDACKRIQVMVRDLDNSDWLGPFTLTAVFKSRSHKYLIINKSEDIVTFRFAKRVK